VSATGISKVYDGGVSATVNLSGSPTPPDTLSYTYTAKFANANAANGIAVNVTGISFTGSALTNYSFNTTASTTANITPFPLTVSATGISKVYDGGVSATVNLSGSPTPPDTLSYTYTSAKFANANAANGINVNVTGISFTGSALTNYAFNTSASTSANITPFSLTISATGIPKTYDGGLTAAVTLSGAPAPPDTLTYSYLSAGFIAPNAGNGITVNVAGISFTGSALTNYSFNSTAVTTANIYKAPLTATVTGTQVYGASPTFTVAGYATFVGTDNATAVNASGLTCSTSALSGSPVGSSYTISSCSGLSATNYNLSYSYGAFSVTPASVTAFLYGAVNYDGEENTFALDHVTYSPFANGDSNSVVSGTASCIVISGFGASGPYGIACQGLSALNYDITYDVSNISNSFASVPAPLIVNVNGVFQNHGTKFAVSSYTYSGFLGVDTPSVVAGTLSCTAKPGPTALSTPKISCGGLSATNYAIGFSYPAGIVSVTPAPLTAIVSESSGPTFSANFSGFVNGDLPSTAVYGSLSCSVSATADSAGNFPISCSGLSASNYNIAYSYAAPAPVSVTPAPLTVNVTGVEYLGGTPTFTVTYSGFTNGDLPSIVSGSLSCVISPTSDGSNAFGETYPITSCSGLTVPNAYALSYWLGDVTNVIGE
jgi:hypothetical protein